MNRQDLLILLNGDLQREYAAAIQYMQHAAVIKGFWTPFAGELEEHAEEELGHAKKLNDWINYWGGIPTMIPSATFSSSESRALIVQDLAGEEEAILRYRERCSQALDMGEFALFDILTDIINDEEGHKNDLQTMLGT